MFSTIMGIWVMGLLPSLAFYLKIRMDEGVPLNRFDWILAPLCMIVWPCIFPLREIDRQIDRNSVLKKTIFTNRGG